MVGLGSLLLPILLSAVVVFFVSAVIHMAIPWHRDEYPGVPREDEFRAALQPFAIPPGDYMVPRAASMEDMKSEAFKAKWDEGPNLIVTVMPRGSMSMTKSLVLWFIYAIVVSIFAAYVAGRTLGAGAEYMSVFRIVGTTAFIGYNLALWQMTIWYHRALKTTVKATVDGLVYALLTAGVFGWLWPA